MRLFLSILTTIAATSLSACGQTGSLYLPEPPKQSRSSAPDAGSRTPAPDSTEPARQP